MSIIHDALKKIQQGPLQTDAPKEKALQNPSAKLFEIPPAPGTFPSQAQQPPVEQKQPLINKIKSVFALLCAMAITIAVFGFLYKQVQTYFPQAHEWAKSSFYKLIHKDVVPDLKTRPPKDLVPLAKIIVNPPPAKPLKPIVPSNPIKTVNPIKTIDPPGPILSPASNVVKPDVPETLNIHGVMSNGTHNLVLINDQVYQEGDDIDGVKIVKINFNYITVINNGQEEKIRVKN